MRIKYNKSNAATKRIVFLYRLGIPLCDSNIEKILSFLFEFLNTDDGRDKIVVSALNFSNWSDKMINKFDKNGDYVYTILETPTKRIYIETSKKIDDEIIKIFFTTEKLFEFINAVVEYKGFDSKIFEVIYHE